MSTAIWVTCSGLFLIAVWATVQFVVVPYFRLQALRKKSEAHVPQEGELWRQDDSLIYIYDVTPSGVEIAFVDGATKAVTRWRDDWQTWHERCRTRVVTFTGQRAPLPGPRD